LFNAPLGLLGAWLAATRLPPGTTSTRGELDVLGLALLSPAIGAFTFAVSALGRARGFSSIVFIPLVASVVLLIAFVTHARRRPTTALLDLRLFTHPMIVAAMTAYLFASFGSFGAQLLLPLYYQQVRGASAIGAGLLIAPQGLGMLLSLPQVGKLTDRFDPGKIVIVGVLLTLAGTAAFTMASEHTSLVLLSISLVVRGIGLGATGTPVLSAAYKALSPEEIPNGTTAINIVQRLGAPLGTAVMAMTLQRFALNAHGRESLSRAFAHTFAVSAALSALSLCAGIALVRTARDFVPLSKGT
jgi:predicted MFS family arabinose efflux permease